MTPSIRIPILAANWKMNHLREEAIRYVDVLRQTALPTGVQVVIAPPFTLLSLLQERLQGTGILLAAQNLFWEPQGAFTGEISPRMLVDTGCRFVIVGHSERRQHFGETDAATRRKVRAALDHGVSPILCVGETLAQREAGQTLSVVEGQLQSGLQEVTPEEVPQVVIAYEPVWAIGTGWTATPETAQEVHGFIREWLQKRFGPERAQAVRIQYGGSVNPQNIGDLMAQPDIDGALVGGASLNPETFLSLVAAGVARKRRSS